MQTLVTLDSVLRSKDLFNHGFKSWYLHFYQMTLNSIMLCVYLFQTVQAYFSLNVINLILLSAVSDTFICTHMHIYVYHSQ